MIDECKHSKEYENFTNEWVPIISKLRKKGEDGLTKSMSCCVSIIHTHLENTKKRSNKGGFMEISLGKKLFEFPTFEKWINKAPSWYNQTGLLPKDCIAIDAKGRICASGKEFIRAQGDNGFPVSVYSIEPEPSNTKEPSQTK